MTRTRWTRSSGAAIRTTDESRVCDLYNTAKPRTSDWTLCSLSPPSIQYSRIWWRVGHTNIGPSAVSGGTAPVCFSEVNVFRLSLRRPRLEYSQRTKMGQPGLHLDTKSKSISQRTSHHLLLVFHGKLVSNPAFSMRPLIPAPRRRPKTVRRKSVTTSWSRGESRSEMAGSHIQQTSS